MDSVLADQPKPFELPLVLRAALDEIDARCFNRAVAEHIRKLLLANAFCHNCGTTEFAPGYTLRIRHGCVLIEGCCAKCGAEVARLCD